jgi:chemotaxis protein methyltransferase CheR
MRDEKLTTRQFEKFRDLIYRQSGIRMDLSKITLVSNRLRRRLKANQLADYDAYYRLVASPGGSSEMESFLDAVTTNETSFFRTPRDFEWFQNEFLREIVLRVRKGEHREPIRIWSAACSTGEEPYSLAICLHEHRFRWADCKATILGTDISVGALQTARDAIYKARSLEGMTANRLKRHFQSLPDGESYQLRDPIRELVEFRRHNLLNSLRHPPFDCIFLRNVMIYFDHDSRQRTVKQLLHSLAPRGYLVVGPSEGVFEMLAPLVKVATCVYQKPDG